MLKHEIKLREDLLKKAQSELQEINSSNTVKVDRYLVKNLVVGYVNADHAKKREVLKIIGEFTFSFFQKYHFFLPSIFKFSNTHVQLLEKHVT